MDAMEERARLRREAALARKEQRAEQDKQAGYSAKAVSLVSDAFAPV